MSTPRHTAPLLEVLSLSKYYGPVAALDDVSCGVREGEILGLIGPNGAGKTTLFECLAGVRPATRGTVRSGGAVIDLEARRTLLFYLPDNVRPWPSETVRWALDFASGYLGAVSSDEAKPSGLRAVIESLRIEPLLRKRMRELSKGQRKRVLLAIGLLDAAACAARRRAVRRPRLAAEPRGRGDAARRTRPAAARSSCRSIRSPTRRACAIASSCSRPVASRGEGTLDELSQRRRARVARPSRRDLEEVFLALT